MLICRKNEISKNVHRSFNANKYQDSHYSEYGYAISGKELNNRDNSDSIVIEQTCSEYEESGQQHIESNASCLKTNFHLVSSSTVITDQACANIQENVFSVKIIMFESIQSSCEKL